MHTPNLKAARGIMRVSISKVTACNTETTADGNCFTTLIVELLSWPTLHETSCHFHGIIKTFFQPGSAAENGINENLLRLYWDFTVSGEECQKLEQEYSFCSFRYLRTRSIGPHLFRCPSVVETMVVSNLSHLVISHR